MRIKVINIYVNVFRKTSNTVQKIFLFLLSLFIFSNEVYSQTPKAGIWRGVLTTPGGELPFNFRYEYDRGKIPAMEIYNGVDTIKISDIEQINDSLIIKFP